ALQENSYLGSSGNTIYVPSTLLDDYKQATYFSDWAEQIVGLDEDGNIVEPEVEVANPELYLVYNTSSSSNTTIEFSTTSAMETWLATNRNNLTGSLKAVRKNVDDNYTDYSYFFPLYTDDWEASITSLDLSEFYTDGATSMEGMFTEAYGLTSLDLSTFDMSQVANINYFLAGTSLTTLNLSNIDTSSITTCEAAFSSANIGTVYWATNKTSVQTITDVPLAPTIYVPSNLVSAYKSDSNFSQVASSIIGI
ncbi:MAG: BspA family leucine-rich repeat surface protein, partial [Opitutales bacterium]